MDIRIWLCLYFCVGGISGVLASDYHVVNTTEQREGHLQHTTTLIQQGENSLNSFTMHRLKKITSKKVRPKGVVILLPSGGVDFSFYLAHKSGDFRRSFAAYFAKQNIEVWGYSPRASLIAPGSCESQAVDCSVMQDWGIQTVINDADFIRRTIQQTYGKDTKIAIGGFSLGAMTGIATINAYPDKYAGLILWEGMLYSQQTEVLDISRKACEDAETKLANGQYYDGETNPGLLYVLSLAQSDPDGASPLLPGFTNRQAFILVLTTPNSVESVPNYTLVAGGLEENGFTYSSEETISAVLSKFNYYVSTRTIRDYSCAIAGEREFTDQLDHFQGSVYAVKAGAGFGNWMDDNIALFSNASSIRTNNIPFFAHADHYGFPYRSWILEWPMKRWMKKKVFK